MSWLFIHVDSLDNYNNKIKTIYSRIVAYLADVQYLRMIFHGNTEDKKLKSGYKEITTGLPTI